ncbi:MAG: NAD-dependent epimerase/dehydratase family protein [Planctomycetota bacterium]|jgi:UDP-glucose 4-epimerase
MVETTASAPDYAHLPPSLAGKRFCVTGAAGFIGSHLTEALLGYGAEVVGLDDLSTGSEQNLRAVAAHPGFQFVKGDARDRALVHSLLRGADGVFHLAATVGVLRVVESAVAAIENLIEPVRVVSSEAAELSVRLVLASTSEVYGRSEQIPFREDQDLRVGAPTEPRFAYACAKLLDEFYVLGLHRERELPVSIARLFNTVGPRQVGRYGMVIPRLVGQALQGAPLTVYGDGSQTRTFLSVGDAVRGLLLLMTSAGATGEVINLGGSREITIRELAERVGQHVTGEHPISLIPFEQVYGRGFSDYRRRVPCIDKAKRILGWEPLEDLASILEAVARDQVEHPSWG